MRAVPTGGSDLKHVIFRPSSAFLRPQIAIVTARAGLLTQTRPRRDAPEATAVASELQTRARHLLKRAVRERSCCSSSQAEERSVARRMLGRVASELASGESCDIQLINARM